MIKVKSELNRIRIKNGYTMSGLARVAGVSPQFISAILNNRFNPSAVTAKKICEVLEVEFDEIFTIEG